jgi:hypothetical protein
LPGDLVDTVPVSRRADLTDEQSAVLVATRFDKLAVRYEATIHIALINEWLLPDL